MLSAAALLAASPGAGHVRADDATTTLKVYFGKEGLGERDAACSRSPPWPGRSRRPKGSRGRHCRSCFAAPRREEREAGYRSWFSDSTRAILKDVRIAGRTAYVDLHDLRQIIPGATSSCGSAEFFAQVEATLKQFPTVDARGSGDRRSTSTFLRLDGDGMR